MQRPQSTKFCSHHTTIALFLEDGDQGLQKRIAAFDKTKRNPRNPVLSEYVKFKMKFELKGKVPLGYSSTPRSIPATILHMSGDTTATLRPNLSQKYSKDAQRCNEQFDKQKSKKSKGKPCAIVDSNLELPRTVLGSITRHPVI